MLRTGDIDDVQAENGHAPTVDDVQAENGHATHWNVQAFGGVELSQSTEQIDRIDLTQL